MAARGERGITYLEVLATAAILGILAMAIIPAAKAGQRKAKEVELQRTLNDIHSCIDEFRMRTLGGMGQAVIGDGKVLNDKSPPLPEKLEDLVKGVPVKGSGIKDEKWKCPYMRVMPTDPMTGEQEWRLHCSDDTESDDSCRSGAGIWRVASKSTAMSLDGKTRYSEW